MESFDSLKGSESSSSLPSADWEEDLKRYHDELPPHLKIGYIDVLILYHEGDRDKAIEFRDHLINDIDIGRDGPILAMLLDEPGLQALSNLKIDHLEKAVERSTYIFIYLTEAFTKDKWNQMSREACLMEAITNPEKQWCVVLVYTEERKKSFKVPIMLNALKRVKYYNNDPFDRDVVSRIIGDNVKVRTRSNEELKIKQKQWIEQFKRYQAHTAETQKSFSSESTKSNKNINIPHSQSNNCIKSVKPQNPTHLLGEGNRPHLSMMQMESNVTQGREDSLRSPYDSRNRGSYADNWSLATLPFDVDTDGISSNVSPSEGRGRPYDDQKARSEPQPIPPNVHLTINATIVQIGDQNVAQSGTNRTTTNTDDDDSGEESDDLGKECVKKVDNVKSIQEQTTGACEEQELKLGKESEFDDDETSSKAGFNEDDNSSSRGVLGEITTHHSGSPGTASSCNIAAARSTIQPREQGLYCPDVGLAKMSPDNISERKPQKTVQATAKKTAENNESFEVSYKRDSYLDKSQGEDSEDTNSSASPYKSNEKQKSVVTVAPMFHPGQRSPQTDKRRAVATVPPFVRYISAQEKGTDSENNENTDPKIVSNSENTDPKRVIHSTQSTSQNINTSIKPVVRNQSVGAENNESHSATPQVHAEARKEEQAKFYYSHFRRQQCLFYRNQFKPASTGSMEAELDSSNESVTFVGNEQVEVGIDPLAERTMQVTESNGLIPETASFRPYCNNNPEGRGVNNASNTTCPTRTRNE